VLEAIRWWLSLPWTTWLDQTNKSISILAVLAGGWFAYLKFIRGRVYHSRLEPVLSGRVFRTDKQTFLLAVITVKNVGATRVDIDQNGTGLRVFSCTLVVDDAAPNEVDWTRITTTEVLTQHEWVESGETVTDTVMITLPPDKVAIKLELRLEPKRRKVTWLARTIVEIAPVSSRPRELQ
jgi:hypothetical protein